MYNLERARGSERSVDGDDRRLVLAAGALIKPAFTAGLTERPAERPLAGSVLVFWMAESPATDADLWQPRTQEKPC